jgi:SAM-dependent methyltransferase
MLTFDKQDINYLSGKEFSSIHPLKMGGNSVSQTRLEFLANFLKGKKVVHFGCIDHLPLVEYRRKTKKWLHEEMDKICAAVVGIDIVQEGIDYMNNNGFEAYNANVVTEPIPERIQKEHWDYLVAGEVLEHIDDPVLFLKSIKEKYGPVTDRIIITVPNAFSYSNFRFALRNIEFINTDHRFWFTAYTLSKVATEAGIKVEGIEFCVDETPSLFSIKRYLVKNRPFFRDRVILIGKL